MGPWKRDHRLEMNFQPTSLVFSGEMSSIFLSTSPLCPEGKTSPLSQILSPEASV